MPLTAYYRPSFFGKSMANQASLRSEPNPDPNPILFGLDLDVGGLEDLLGAFVLEEGNHR